MITKEFIDQIARAYEASNPRKKGQWLSDERGHPDKRGWRLFVAKWDASGMHVPICELSNCNARGEGYEDAKLIALLYNSWPEIEKALRAQLRAQKALKKAHARRVTRMISYSNQPYGTCERCRTVGFWNCPTHKDKPRKTKTS